MTTTNTTAITYRDGDRCTHDYWPTACGICATPTTAYNLQDELERAEAGQPSTIPCPGWCGERSGHRFEQPNGRETTRLHRRQVPARDGAPSVTIWALDELNDARHEIVEADAGATDSNKADVPMQHVPAFAEAMQTAARIVEEHQGEPGFRLYADDPKDDDVLARMDRESIDVEAALRGVDGVMETLSGITLPTTTTTGVDVDTADGADVTLLPDADGVALMVPGGTIHLDGDALVNLAAAALRLRVLRV